VVGVNVTGRAMFRRRAVIVAVAGEAATDRRARKQRGIHTQAARAPAPSFLVSRIDLSWKTMISVPRPREDATARFPALGHDGHIITIGAGLPTSTCQARTAETSKSCRAASVT
jgi:hypothetical protein